MNSGIPLDDAFFFGMTPDQYARWRSGAPEKTIKEPEIQAKKPMKQKRKPQLPLRKGAI